MVSSRAVAESVTVVMITSWRGLTFPPDRASTFAITDQTSRERTGRKTSIAIPNTRLAGLRRQKFPAGPAPSKTDSTTG